MVEQPSTVLSNEEGPLVRKTVKRKDVKPGLLSLYLPTWLTFCGCLMGKKVVNKRGSRKIGKTRKQTLTQTTVLVYFESLFMSIVE